MQEYDEEDDIHDPLSIQPTPIIVEPEPTPPQEALQPTNRS
jgi:hypothetical protein